MQADWQVFASLGIDSDLLGGDQKIWLLAACAVPRVCAAGRSQFIGVPITPCKWMLDCICTRDICESFWIMCRKPDSGCLSHMPNKDSGVTVLGPFPFHVSSALPPLHSLNIGYTSTAQTQEWLTGKNDTNAGKWGCKDLIEFCCTHLLVKSCVLHMPFL